MGEGKKYSPKNPRRRTTHNRVERSIERSERRSGQKACEDGYQEYEMEQHYLKEWKRFLTGHWQKEMPKREGAYPIHPRSDPRYPGMTANVVHHDGKYFCANYLPLGRNWADGHIPEGTSWAGWWWSEPIPDLPPVVVEEE
jgi:hypothetical protein